MGYSFLVRIATALFLHLCVNTPIELNIPDGFQQVLRVREKRSSERPLPMKVVLAFFQFHVRR